MVQEANSMLTTVFQWVEWTLAGESLVGNEWVSLHQCYLGLHAVAVFTVDTATVWVCRIRPVMRNMFTMMGRLAVQNGGI